MHIFEPSLTNQIILLKAIYKMYSRSYIDSRFKKIKIYVCVCVCVRVRMLHFVETSKKWNLSHAYSRSPIFKCNWTPQFLRITTFCGVYVKYLKKILGNSRQCIAELCSFSCRMCCYWRSDSFSYFMTIRIECLTGYIF